MRRGIPTLVVCLTLTAASSGCDTLRNGQRRDVLVAVAEHIRERADSAFADYIGEYVPRNYAIHLEADSVSAPDVLAEAARRIGNATAGPNDTLCEVGVCRDVPDAPVLVRFSAVDLVRQDSATVDIDVYVQPWAEEPLGYWRMDRFYLIRRNGEWAVLKVATTAES